MLPVGVNLIRNAHCDMHTVISYHHTGFVQEVYLPVRDDHLFYKCAPDIASGDLKMFFLAFIIVFYLSVPNRLRLTFLKNQHSYIVL